MTYGDGRAWRAGPHQVYRRLAEAAVDTLPSVTGLTTVDAGAGTGAMAEALAARGARVVCADRSLPMVREALAPRLVGDIRAMPVRSRSVDLVAAGFVLSHVEDPEVALAELRRVARLGGRIVATAFPAGHRHPVKEAVDEVLREFGYQPPAWYLRLKETGEARVGDPAALAQLARDAGRQTVRVDQLAVSVTDLDVETVVSWRLGMAQVAGFVAALPEPRHQQLTVAARDAVATVGLAAPVPMLVLVSQVA